MGIDKPITQSDAADTDQQAAAKKILEDNKGEKVPAGAAQKESEALPGLVVEDKDKYSYHQGPRRTGEQAPSKPEAEKEGEAKKDSPNKTEEKLSPAEEAHLKKYRAELEGKNFTLHQIDKGWGPYQALDAMVKEGKIKMSPQEMKKEAERIRDRDFEANNRKFYKVGEKPEFYSKEEIDKKVQAELGKFREAEAKRVEAEKQAAEKAAAAKAEAERKAAEKQAAERAAAEKKTPEAKIPAQKAPENNPSAEKAEREKSLRSEIAPALEKLVPKNDKLQAAARALGYEVDDKLAQQFRDLMKEQITKEVLRGSMDKKMLENPMPPVGAVLVATGAVSTQQLDKAVKEQDEMRKAGQKPPMLGDMLKEQLKNDQEALKRLELSSKFYDRLYQEVTGKPRVAPTKPAQPQAERTEEKK